MPSAPDKTPSRIAGMFDAIAPRYDLLNHLLSAGLDRRWRERAVDALELKPGTRVLDLCTGTADVAIAAARRASRPSIVGVDFAGSMLTLGLEKIRDEHLDRQIYLIRGDATRIPVADGTCQAATIAFGIRNVAEPEKAIAELARVLRPGSRLAILEFGAPRIPGVRTMYDVVLPLPLAVASAGPSRSIRAPTLTSLHRSRAFRHPLSSRACSPRTASRTSNPSL